MNEALRKAVGRCVNEDGYPYEFDEDPEAWRRLLIAAASEASVQALVLRAVAAKSNGVAMKQAMGVLFTALETGASPFELERS